MTALVVFSMPGREPMTARTLQELEERGGASSFAGPKFLWWSGATPPTFQLPAHWSVVLSGCGPRGGREDFFAMLEDVGAGDLLVLEDDVQPCRNLVPYLARWR